MTSVTEVKDDGRAGSPPAAPLRAQAAWVLFDWAGQPFYTLVLTFLFAPYFANAVAPDPVTGQALWGYGASAAGLAVALLSPFLGAVADGRGRRKPWIWLFSIVMVLGTAALWYAVPAASMTTIVALLAAFAVATVAIEFATVFTNAMMPSLVPREQLGRLSGIGWGVGYVGGLVSLAIMAGLIVTNPATDKTLFGLAPVFQLDTAMREGDRLVGPFSALWYAVFMIPFFLFVPDAKAPVANADRRPALAELFDTMRELPGHRDMLLFLVARMIYADGLAAIFTFGGIYGAAVFGWGSLELGLFGIVLTFTGAIGGIVGGILDDRHGTRLVILISLLVLTLGTLGILSVGKDHVLFGVPVVPKAPGSGPFTAVGEQVYLVFAILIGLVAAPVQAASRTMLVHLAPKDKLTQYFGLFAFSGKVTAFLAPFLVAAMTEAWQSQRAGVAVIVLFLATGFGLLLAVRERPSTTA